MGCTFSNFKFRTPKPPPVLVNEFPDPDIDLDLPADPPVLVRHTIQLTEQQVREKRERMIYGGDTYKEWHAQLNQRQGQ